MRSIAISVALLLATIVSAAPSSRYAEWRNSPAKWLFTPEDEQAWRGVGNDDEARQFIALFWARRDPTPGTPKNEYRDEFDHRVALADVAFTRNKVRGALTDVGRVLIVLGPPQGGSLPLYSGTGHGALTVPQSVAYFRYTAPVPLGLTGPVKFVAIADGPYQMAPEGGAPGALAAAVGRAVVNPALRDVPPWAAAAPAWQRFHVALLRATSDTSGGLPGAVPPELEKPLNDVRALLPYKRYQFVDTVAFSAQPARPETVTMRGPAGKPYRVTLRFVEPGPALDVSSFHVEQEKGAEVVSSAFAIKPGETVSVGASGRETTKDAALFFLTWVTE